VTPRILFACLAVAALAACDSSDTLVGTEPVVEPNAARGGPPVRSYEITVENLTRSGQAFTPPAIALHRPAVDLFEVGEPASRGVREIAENGNLAPLLDLLGSSRHVGASAVGATPPVPPLEPGETVTLTLEARPGFPFVSVVSMLICTNDGFTGLDAGRLPTRVGESRSWYADAYDAGSEINTEDFADIVPPCPALSGVPSDDVGTGTSDPALAEDGVIRHHPGIRGGDDLIPAIHGWSDPVAKITVVRTG
jgi:hypothetical protein